MRLPRITICVAIYQNAGNVNLIAKYLKSTRISFAYWPVLTLSPIQGTDALVSFFVSRASARRNSVVLIIASQPIIEVGNHFNVISTGRYFVYDIFCTYVTKIDILFDRCSIPICICSYINRSNLVVNRRTTFKQKVDRQGSCSRISIVRVRIRNNTLIIEPKYFRMVAIKSSQCSECRFLRLDAFGFHIIQTIAFYFAHRKSVSKVNLAKRSFASSIFGKVFILD